MDTSNACIDSYAKTTSLHVVLDNSLVESINDTIGFYQVWVN